jgi:bifunctional DNA-binding transcriptional regulator/antitoxin component of YhaV-PrlF toxin-antitoxin module
MTLPASVRRRFNLHDGDVVSIEDTAGGVLLTPHGSADLVRSEALAALAVEPSPEETARRQALFAEVLERRNERDIRPLTSADLVHMAREEAGFGGSEEDG